MSFRNRIMFVIAIASILCSATAIFVSRTKISAEGESRLIDKSRAVLSRMEVVRDFVATQAGLGDKIKGIVKEFPDGKIPEDKQKEIIRQVPIYAAMTVGSEGAEKEHYSFRVFSDHPRREANKASESESEIFQKFSQNDQLKELVETDGDKVVVYRPVRLSEAQGCLTCHGDPQKSPWGNGKDILGYPMENWADNKLHGVFALTSSKDEIKAAATSSTIHISLWNFSVTLLSLLLGFFLIRGTFKNLAQVTSSLQEAGEHVSSASNEISTSSQALSSSTSESAASLEETTASTEEMSSMINLNANNAESAKELSKTCEQKARLGKSEVDRLIVAMNDISSSSKKIEEIISVIDDIAFQTNLLALNAAVEAARAGEQGKGFSVVAEAVRSLAQRSATSAKEISDFIKESVQKIQVGSSIAKASGDSLTEIVSSVEKVAELNSEISSASREQSQGVMNINKAVNELDKVTQQNAIGAQETAAASEALSIQAGKLHELVQHLNHIVDGRSDKSKTGPISPAVVESKNKYEEALPMMEGSSTEKLSKVKSNKISSIDEFNKAS